MLFQTSICPKFGAGYQGTTRIIVINSEKEMIVSHGDSRLVRLLYDSQRDTDLVLHGAPGSSLVSVLKFDQCVRQAPRGM